MSVLCYKCGCTLGSLAQFCGSCNAELERKSATATAFAAQIISKPCPECHHGTEPNSSQCGACGYDFAHAEPRPFIYVGVPLRMAAAAIDLALIAIPIGAMALVVDKPLVVIMFAILFPLLYCVGFWSLDGATPGKAAFGLRVVTTTGEPIDAVHAFIRFTGYMISAVVAFTGYIMMVGNKERRAFYDYWAGSVVVKSRRRS
ncbi:MAG: RDD family protein [Dehalococcoidia bacterium]